MQKNWRGSSQRSEAEAQAAFRSLQAKYPNQLGGRQLLIHKADLGAKDGGVYRWTGSLSGDTFVGQYTSASGKKGEFRMTREQKK